MPRPLDVTELFPGTGFTREDARGYYQAIAPLLLPHLRRRPLSFKRYPADVLGDSFWEKDAPSFTPEWIQTFPVPRRSGASAINYIVVNNRKSLLWVIDAGGLELHPFLHVIPHIERPTQIVFDLDPGSGADIADCCDVAIILREHLARLGLQSYAKVSGSKGLQVYVPLNTPGVTHELTETFARLVADDLAREHRGKIVAKMTRSARAGRVFIDWSQNADYKTTVAVYSLRAKRDRPMVSMPLRWSEVERKRDLEFVPDDAVRRVRKAGDLFEPVLTQKQKLPPALVKGFQRIPLTASRTEEEPEGVVVNGIRLPKKKSQSGRRLFVLTRGEVGNELWLDANGRFRRFILRPDRTGGDRLIAMPAGQFPVADSYYRGEVQPEYRGTVQIDDIGVYEIIEGSFAREEMRLWFTGTTLAGEWSLVKTTSEVKHRSWTLAKL